MSGEVVEGAQAWEADGSGDRGRTGVVVVHGLTGNPISVNPLARHLNAAGFAVEVPRLPGHGTSVEDLTTTRYPQWREEVERAVVRTGTRCEQVVLAGLSMGGTLALDVASDRGDLAGVVTINAPLRDPTGLVVRLAPVLQHVVPTLRRDLAGLPFDDIAKPGADERAYPRISARAAQSLIGELPRIREQVAAMTTPILVAWSPQDHTVDPGDARALLDLVASEHVETLVMERSYHVATLDWDADLLATRVEAFVAGVSGS